MSNEPKVSMNLDPELLAAYIDQRLSPEQRAVVEAQLATDPDSYAVLVETMKALEEVPSVKAPKGRVPGARRWVIAGGVLATAAALVLAVRLSDSSSNSELAGLVSAVRTERPVEARLTGGFEHARVASVTRGLSELAANNLALVASAAAIQQRVTANPTRENRKAWAAAQILTGQFAAATETLARLSSEDPNDAAIHSDLAAALLSRVASGEAANIVPALEHASQAARLAPELPEAAFNHALALEAASLVSQSLDEWKRFVKLEPDSSWREEGQQHIRDLEQRLVPKPSAAIPQSAAELLRVADGAVMAPTPEWRRALEGPILIDLLRSPNASAWAKGIQLASDLARQTNDQLTLLIWQHAQAYPRPESVRAGLETYLAARVLLDANQRTQALERFELADDLLRQTGSPAASWTRFYLAHSLFFLGQTQAAIDRVAPLAREAASVNALSVEIRALYLLGLGQLRLGQHAAVIETQRRTATLAKRAGVQTTEISARSEVADALMRLSIPHAAWIERLLVLDSSQRLGDPAVRHVVMVGAARAASTEEFTSAAEAFATAALENGLQWKNRAAQAEARIRLADVFDRRDDSGRALALLQDAERDLASLPDSAFADGWRADLELARGSASLTSSHQDAYAASLRAFEILSKRYSPFREARARWLHGMSLVHSDPARARASFIAGLLATENEGAGADPFGRSLADQRWHLMRELIALPWTSADAGLRDVWGALLGRTASDSLASIQERLEPAELIVVFAALDDRLVRWQVTHDAVERRDIRVQRQQLVDLIEQHRRRIADPGSADWATPTASLAGILFDGISSQAPSRLLVVTDGVTSHVTFGALRWPGSKEPLVDSADLAILASDFSSELRRVRGSKPIVLVAASPTNSLSAFLSPLPGAMEEGRQVAALYENPVVMLGPSATRQQLLAVLPSVDVFHFAGHAIGDPSDPAASRLLLSENTELTARDIVQQRLRARVVVLGSCHGALSATAGNVAAYGLARAFLQAGALEVVASQWEVDDRFAIGVMTQLHTRLAGGTPPARAIREIQSNLRHEPRFSHPYFWAGFSVYTRLVSQSQGVNE